MKSYFIIFVIVAALINAVLGETCRKGYSVKKGSKVSFSSNDGMCKFDIIGDTGCKVQLTCNLDFPKKTGDCEDVYLEIADGVKGSQQYCGKISLKNIQPQSPDLRDLFVDATSSESKKWACTATCSTKGGARLPDTYKKTTDFRCVCGLQNDDDRIVGGANSKLNEFPWQAAVVFPSSRSPICGAAILNDKFVLSAAHCYAEGPMKPQDIEVLLHAYNLDMTEQAGAADVALGEEGSLRGPGYKLKGTTDEAEKSQRFKVAEIILHPLYTTKYDYDFALIRLEKRVNFFDADSPTPICLPIPKTQQLNETYAGKQAVVSGWGLAHEKAGASTKILQKLTVPVFPLSRCKELVFAAITDRMLCAGFEAGEHDACTGDSGGPLVYQKSNKQFEQIGVVSWGVGCARVNKPGFYSRVTEGLQWILQHTKTNDAKWCREKK